jgi:hypothetical protein
MAERDKLHAFQATPLDSDSDSESAASAEQAGTRERNHVVLSENVRQQLQQRLRFHLPGIRPTQPQ